MRLNRANTTPTPTYKLRPPHYRLVHAETRKHAPIQSLPPREYLTTLTVQNLRAILNSMHATTRLTHRATSLHTSPSW